MVFQATKWNWKRLAARALLIPVLAGSAGVALAQFRSSSPAGANKTAAGPVMTAAAPGDPKSMLKEGRKALAAGHFNDAQDYARRADDSARAKNFKWGLFDDTPNALLKDVQAAVVKTQKHEAERLVKQAKTLLAKHPANDREKAANLDAALQMARRADSLHGGGGYSVWDFGDRPDKMVKEIEAARAKMKLPPAPVQNKVVTAMGTQKPGAPSGVVPAGGLKAPVNNAPATPASNYSNFTRTQTPTANAAVDPRKVAAVKLMTEGRQLANQGDFAGAHAKYTGAQKLNARFAANEFGPDSALQDLNLHGSMAIKNLIEDAKTKMQRKDFARADAALNAAHDIALALNLFPLPIEKAKADLRTATNGKFGGVSPSGLSPAAGTERLIPLGPAPAAPVPTASAPGVANIVSPATPPKPATARVEVPALPLVSAPPVVTPPAVVTPAVATPANITPGALTSRQMLYQAAQEYTKGDFDIAAKLARQAYNLGNEQEKVQATGLLNSIDVDVAAAKKRNAAKSYEAAVAAYQRHDHGHALSVFVVIDPNLLPADQRAKRDEMIASCKAELDKSGAKVAVHAGGVPPEGTLQPVPGVIPPGTARVGDGRPSNPDSLATQADSLRKVAYQKMRSEGLKVQSDAQAAFGRGETDVAMQMLIDYSNRVRAAGLDTASVALLLRPIDSRMEMFRVMKGQKDAITRVNRENREAKELVTSRAGADEQRKAEVAKLVRQYKGLMKEFKYSEAERVAMQAVQLQPDDVALDALRTLAKTQRRLKNQNNVDLAKEGMFAEGMLAAENEGPFVDSNDPVSLDIRRMLASRGRGRGDDAYLRSRTPKEFEIELKLDRPVLIDYTGMPLSQVIEDLRDKTKVDFSWDTPSLTAEQISTAMPINEKLTQGMSLRNALHLILDKAKLSFVIEYDTVRITTQKMAKGRLVTKVFSVADLVTPIPNFAVPDYANFEKMLAQASTGASGIFPSGGLLPANSNQLGGGTPTGAQLGASLGTAGNSRVGVSGNLKFDRSATIENDAISQSSSAVADRGTKHEQLMRLVTSMVRPLSWEVQGGNGKVEFFDLGSALVVNQTADVIREVSDLLEALRKLQDLAVAVEVRIISLSETWFERMGVDFSMNIKTNTSKFEPSLTSGQFRPEPFINDINQKGTTVGLQPAGVFTPDLDVPIKSTSFQYAIPGFGGFPNNPGNDGGVSLGLAFLNDIQVYMFMEAAQGDRRVNVMQAPKLTLFNGQTATINISDLQFFVTSVQVFSVNGQVVFIPRITPLPGPAGSLQSGNRLQFNGNVTIALQAVVSADRRFVRINLPITLAAQSGATVPLFPITTFITPVFEGGSQGVPIPFTQFIQQPAFTAMQISTTVVCPDGGTVLLGGLKQLSEGRNEFGPPFLSKIPYLNRLFKNVGIGRDTSHIMIMVTPRIIINSEEEINQTEAAPLGAGGPPR